MSFLVVYLVLAFFPRPQNVEGSNPMLTSGDLPLLIAHGGGNREFPDNTLEAYYHAYSVDPNVMLETDVSLTKDGVVLLSHDTTLDHKTNLQYADIIDLNYTDLMADEVDFGYDNPTSGGYNTTGELILYVDYLGNSVTPLDVTYPEGVEARHSSKFLATTLEDLIVQFPNNKINVEIKQSVETGLSALAAVIDLMETYDDEYNTFSRIVIASFHEEVYQEMLQIKANDHPELMFSPESDSVTRFFVLKTLGLDVFYFDQVAVFQVPISQSGIELDTKTFINALHRHNIAVHYWTVNDPDEMRLLIEYGADGIMTDIPSLLKQVFEEYQ